jgi:hypothetical protein
MRSTERPSHFAIGMLLLTCLVCFNSPLRLSSLGQSNDEEAIRKLVVRIFELHQQKDIDKLLALWSKKSPSLAENKKGLQRVFSAFEKIAVKGFDIRKSQIDGDRATLRVSADLALTRAGVERPTERVEKKNRTIQLINENGIWKVWRFSPSEDELVAAIVAAKTEEERTTLIEKEPELVTSDLVSALIRYYSPDSGDQEHYRRALAINQLAYKIAEQIDDQWLMAAALVNAGTLHGWLGKEEKSLERSLEYFQKSLKIGEEHGFKLVAAESLVRSARIYQSLREPSQAAERFLKAIKFI